MISFRTICHECSWDRIYPETTYQRWNGSRHRHAADLSLWCMQFTFCASLLVTCHQSHQQWDNREVYWWVYCLNRLTVGSITKKGSKRTMCMLNGTCIINKCNTVGWKLFSWRLLCTLNSLMIRAPVGISDGLFCNSLGHWLPGADCITVQLAWTTKLLQWFSYGIIHSIHEHTTLAILLSRWQASTHYAVINLPTKVLAPSITILDHQQQHCSRDS